MAEVSNVTLHSFATCVTLNPMSPIDSICFGLLAGGQSRRMGVDKASLLWRGKPLWQHQLQLALEIGATEILISGKADGPYSGAASIITDEIKDCGPIGGLAALLAGMESHWLLVAGVDMPFLEVDTLQAILRAREKDRGVIPTVNGRVHALAAVYPRAAAALAKEHTQAEDRSLQSFARAAEAAGLVRLVPWKTEAAFRSLNTPEEWATANRS